MSTMAAEEKICFRAGWGRKKFGRATMMGCAPALERFVQRIGFVFSALGLLETERGEAG